MTSVGSPLPVEKGFAVPLPFSFAPPIPLGATVSRGSGSEGGYLGPAKVLGHCHMPLIHLIYVY